LIDGFFTGGFIIEKLLAFLRIEAKRVGAVPIGSVELLVPKARSFSRRRYFKIVNTMRSRAIIEKTTAIAAIIVVVEVELSLSPKDIVSETEGVSSGTMTGSSTIPCGRSVSGGISSVLGGFRGSIEQI
jgi:hypothetical protein